MPVKKAVIKSRCQLLLISVGNCFQKFVLGLLPGDAPSLMSAAQIDSEIGAGVGSRDDTD